MNSSRGKEKRDIKPNDH